MLDELDLPVNNCMQSPSRRMRSPEGTGLVGHGVPAMGEAGAGMDGSDPGRNDQDHLLPAAPGVMKQPPSRARGHRMRPARAAEGRPR